ncbi:MAG: DMP19 family protein [Methylotenera sp.]|uniref:DMP19 family protein n=1 Tax=Methylotenera sp. TaxID=2051956 RepID=UPI0017D0CF7C|nr:DMP19 family protein [Methylotenera sp.]NOU24563.1 DMP19 family protein [Methylotenera sp.]
MQFSDVSDQQDPAYKVYCAAFDVVFDKNDGDIEHINRLSRESRIVYLLWNFDGEIHNGGFDQLFFNSLGDYCLEILGYLEELGALKSYILLSKAISLFPNSLPANNRQERWSQLNSFSSSSQYQMEIDQLNSEYWKYEDKLNDLLDSYVLAHPHVLLLLN